MISEENAARLKEWADRSKEVEAELRETNKGRDAVVRHVLKLGAGVGEIVALTGLTRARIYQIRDAV